MKKVLVANRGEIALRIMKTLKRMNIQTVAVYSDVDEDAPFVKFADEAFCIGEATPSESYLNMDKILEVAITTNTEGIHPGYGFLSENAIFAEKVDKAGIKFIGPSIEAIKVMGDKLDAKQAVKAFDVPMVPGTDEAITDIAEAKKIAAGIGYPILIKASAGGGGKGMRVVESEDLFEEQFDRAVSEAVSSFGNGAVFIEKFVQQPKHIEIQVLADAHGNVIHLNERECSIQRRHQKVVEEAPSPVVDAALRAKIGEAAVNVAKSCNYEGVGTVEFLLDKDKNFYFLEMNTRLQVEHPVTEQITGLDLVELQIQVARGEELSLKQEDVGLNGHSIEIRVYAEDPENDFLPDLGKIVKYTKPKGLGVRVDDGYTEGMKIPLTYDPMIAKLIVHGKDRDEAIERLLKAIDEYEIIGFSTTLGFCHFAVDHEEFRNGNFTINFVGDYYKPEMLRVELPAEVGELAYEVLKEIKQQAIPVQEDQHFSAWQKRK
ncbi:acetyl-CoA carboxylase biotin carboxylase subunit [Paracrocinitomix mangrovi]|uniref:acetyl-CoA carboxylase biotin carboxylase subunit n=1 Tax=Paracrocinitomix mangrovi TaxID=2862509 RepID=UPI001C8CFF11|nr:acetyl-CoA carboxylase biotin carboxylase subunit [Paracrocinitomix mangrovi]UKN02624.1 acetyl-CoA carboxylase biotin carboxylase subunit [Paracrocinitomix mangrovi]